MELGAQTAASVLEHGHEDSQYAASDGHGRRAHSATNQWPMLPSGSGGQAASRGPAQARANTQGPQVHDWICPGCGSTTHGRHRACPNCQLDRLGHPVALGLCPWRCGECGHINTYKELACRGKNYVGCGHLRSIVGGPRVEFTGDDWVCVPCIEHGQQKVRMWVGKTECRFCHTAREDMFGVTRVRDYPQGTVFL